MDMYNWKTCFLIEKAFDHSLHYGLIADDARKVAEYQLSYKDWREFDCESADHYIYNAVATWFVANDQFFLDTADPFFTAYSDDEIDVWMTDYPQIERQTNVDGSLQFFTTRMINGEFLEIELEPLQTRGTIAGIEFELVATHRAIWW